MASYPCTAMIRRISSIHRLSQMGDALLVQHEGAIATLHLNRPELHNAFDAALIQSLTATLQALGADPAVRAVVLAGNGPSFSAGADLQWMRSMATPPREKNAPIRLPLPG